MKRRQILCCHNTEHRMTINRSSFFVRKKTKSFQKSKIWRKFDCFVAPFETTQKRRHETENLESNKINK